MKSNILSYVTLISAATASLSCLAAQADTASTPTPVATAPAAVPLPIDVVKAHLHKVETTFGRAAGISFTEHIGVQVSGTTAGPQRKFADITGELTKPPKYKYTIANGGTLVSDGVSELAVDPASVRYNLRPSTRQFTVGDDWAFISTKVLSGTSEVLNESLVAYLYEHIGSKDFLEPPQMQLAGFNNTAYGKQVIDIEYKNETDDIHLLVDAKTDQIVGLHSIYYSLNGLVTEVIEDVTSLTLLTTAPPATDFSTTPPPTAKPVAVPVAPPPKAAPAKPTTKPSTRPRSNNKSKKGIIYVF